MTDIITLLPCQEQEEDVASRVKQHLVNALVSQGSSDTVSTQAGALRR